MFKKIANLLFEDVEIEEEEIEIEEKVEKVSVKPEIVKTETVEVPQKTFTEVKEKSIFITNTTEEKVKPKIKEKVVEKVEEKKPKTYSFTPILSPIRGLKDEEKNEYETVKVTKALKKKSNYLNTVISPFHGGVDKNEEEEDLVEYGFNDDIQTLELRADEHPVVDDTVYISDEYKPLKEEFINLTLEDLLSSDSEDEVVVNLDNNRKTHYFIGIKGSGMAALANLLHDDGYPVMGSDTLNYVFTEVELKEKGIHLADFGEDEITSDMVVIVGASFKEDHVDVIKARNANATIYTYAEFLGKYINDYVSIAVSGTHGKTTTTSLISDMLRANVPTAHLIGDGRGASDEDSEIIVVEACEYKRHFLNYKADYAVITNVEWEHVDYFHTVDDYYLSFEEFANQIKNTVLVFGDDPKSRDLKIETDVLYYGEEAFNDLYAKNINETSEYSSFEVVYKGEDLGEFRIYRTGRHMVYNALASIGIGLLLGFSADDINEGLKAFKGARRRFDVVEIGENVVIDDYAHHPTEIVVTLQAAMSKYPNRDIIAVYRPDRISRIETFKDEYIQALSFADQAAICTAVDSDGLGPIDTGILVGEIPKSFVVDDHADSVSQLAFLTPAVFVFMAPKEIHYLKEGLIDYLNKIDI